MEHLQKRELHSQHSYPGQFPKARANVLLILEYVLYFKNMYVCTYVCIDTYKIIYTYKILSKF